jgi:hypothetical protein
MDKHRGSKRRVVEPLNIVEDICMHFSSAEDRAGSLTLELRLLAPGSSKWDFAWRYVHLAENALVKRATVRLPLGVSPGSASLGQID